MGLIQPDSAGVDSAWISGNGSAKPILIDLRHLRGHRRDPAARNRPRHLRHAHQV